MSLLQNYVDSVRAGDAPRLAALFTPDGLFHDEAPTTIGMDPVILRGRDAIAASFGTMFGGGGITVANVAINGSAMRYDIVLGPDTSIQCLGVVAREADGLIAEYYVTAVPADTAVE